MNEIPAGTTDGVDLRRLRATNPDAAAQIETIGAKLRTGDMTFGELLALCQLLYDAGERGPAESLLRANVTEGDDGYKLYRRLFGDRSEVTFERAISRFVEQFGIKLNFQRSPRFLCREFSVMPGCYACNCPSKLRDIFGQRSGIQITYFDANEIVADAYVIPNGTGLIDLSEQLVYKNESWVIQAPLVP